MHACICSVSSYIASFLWQADPLLSMTLFTQKSYYRLTLKMWEWPAIYRFWSQIMIYIHAYNIGFYFAVRSENWVLRNSSLKVLTELFFAYIAVISMK